MGIEAKDGSIQWMIDRLVMGDFPTIEDRDSARAELAAIKAELAELRMDKDRLDWLADKDNHIGNVQLPLDIVYRHMDSLRDAIDEAMGKV